MRTKILWMTKLSSEPRNQIGLRQSIESNLCKQKLLSLRSVDLNQMLEQNVLLHSIRKNNFSSPKYSILNVLCFFFLNLK